MNKQEIEKLSCQVQNLNSTTPHKKKHVTDEVEHISHFLYHTTQVHNFCSPLYILAIKMAIMFPSACISKILITLGTKLFSILWTNIINVI